jgi:small subunit ribosomal protein S6
MSKNYEMMYVLRPDLSEEQLNGIVNKYRDFLTDQGATDLNVQIRGRRRLAYDIKRYQDGIYVQMNYKASGKQVAPLERAMRLSEEVLRYLTIRLKDDKASVPNPAAAAAVAAADTPAPAPEPEAEPVEVEA